MTHESDSGVVTAAIAAVLADYPGAETYPGDSFRVEWGPIFHRGRLDGSARVLVLGQDPAQAEAIVRRILVGEAGHRTQGLLAKLGIDRSYVMINTFLYSVYGRQGGEQHKDDPGIVAYRHRWLDAIFADAPIEAVVALGYLADDAWAKWRATPNGHAHPPAYEHVTHPTQPESSAGGDPAALRAAIKAMLDHRNAALSRLHPKIAHPDHAGPLVPYGTAFGPGDRAEIPEADVPPGVPAWMRSPRAWARRTGSGAAAKRRTITVTVPDGVVVP